ncbi:hypothetical protein [Streptomyces alanosinicus]|uniref:Uncharacterized protein n=1 Tax=Streptomyces alanosinicus TaxID=68171 RepID=A0A918YN08_9ACTN|nr:hypothetical protein [Streptomyces alanosinicus]GHE09038.1 hypothetical protein GCM10010339_60030 [Streptomyces alanosinicus]
MDSRQLGSSQLLRGEHVGVGHRERPGEGRRRGLSQLIGTFPADGAKEGEVYNKHHAGDDDSTPSVQDREPQSTTANLETAPLDQLPAAGDGMLSNE